MRDSWTRVGTLLPAVLATLAGCARLAQVDEPADAGPAQPSVASVEPPPGPVPGEAKFVVSFSEPMDEVQLLAASGRSETVVIATEADVERAAAAIARPKVSVQERELFVAAAAEVATDLRSLSLSPDARLVPGSYFLLVSPRLRDTSGRRLLGTGARFAFQVLPPPRKAKLTSPLPGAQVPRNLSVLRAMAEGRLALLGPDGAELAAVDAKGAVELPVPLLAAGARYRLSLDGVPDEEQSFMAAACTRSTAPQLLGGEAILEVRDSSVGAQLVLDWPAQVELQIAEVAGQPADDPCRTGSCVLAETRVACAPAACGPQSFSCAASLHVDGLKPATPYLLRVVARDDQGYVLSGPQQQFATLAALPRLLLTEVMSSPPPPAPRGDGEYLELLNLGPGSAALENLALAGPDGVLRPLLASLPPLPLRLAPGQRALAVGSSFDASRYHLPPGTPVLRAATRRLLGRGLSDAAPPPLKIVLTSAVPVELASFPGSPERCAPGVSLQRDESAPPGAEAAFHCGRAGGTPGAAP